MALQLGSSAKSRRHESNGDGSVPPPSPPVLTSLKLDLVRQNFDAAPSMRYGCETVTWKSEWECQPISIPKTRDNFRSVHRSGGASS